MLRVENRGVIPGGCTRAKMSIYDEMRTAVEPPADHLRNMTAKGGSRKSSPPKKAKRKAA